MDTSALVTSIGELSTDITTVGGALIGVAGVVLVYRWLKGFLFG